MIARIRERACPRARRRGRPEAARGAPAHRPAARWHPWTDHL